MSVGAVFAAATVFLGALVLIGFDWAFADVLSSTLLGIVFWGAFTYVLEVHHEVPETDALRVAPLDAEIRRVRRPRWRLLLILPFCVAVAWGANRWDAGGLMVPGQFAGYASANLFGAILVGRWQREHGGEVLIRYEGVDDPELYVAP